MAEGENIAAETETTRSSKNASKSENTLFREVKDNCEDRKPELAQKPNTCASWL